MTKGKKGQDTMKHRIIIEHKQLREKQNQQQQKKKKQRK